MAASSQVSQNKRGRDEYWNGGLASPEAKRANSGFTLADADSDLMAFLEEIDNMDNNNSKSEETDAVSEIESEMRLNGVIESLEDEIGLKAKTENKIESTNEKGSADHVGSAATSVCDIGDLTYYDDVQGEFDFFVECISPNDLGIIINNYIDGDSMANIMYLQDAVHCYAEAPEDFYGSLWEHDIGQLNEHPAIQNFESPKTEKVGLGVSEAEFHDVWNDIKPIQLVSDNEERL